MSRRTPLMRWNVDLDLDLDFGEGGLIIFLCLFFIL